ncbi:MAG: AAA family ATPase [Clostridiales bacterium]|nr:AAA family ATPase [Clostridiales bacterium]
MNRALKDAISSLFDFCDTGKSNWKNAKGISIERDQLKTEFINFVSYLSASDGTIATFEAEFLNTYFDVFMTAEELRKYIDKNNTYTSEFEQTVPKTLISLVERDNNVYANSGKLSISYSATYCAVFECVAKEFLVCDGEASETEVSDMTIYITMLNDYRRNNYVGPKNVTSGIDVTVIHAGENIPKINEKGEVEETLGDFLEELNNLVGLETVKRDVNSLIHLQEIKRLRKARGLKEIPVSNHLVFYGNPGTGKTTVARLLAKIYHAMGILSQGQFVEVDRSGLVAGYVGQTALKVQEVVKSALGGVLFIDEAYALTHSSSSNDYGQEAIDTLLKAMEDNREDFIVIVAGYPELMVKFIDSNPGLRSRFNKYINFEDYSVAELTRIYKVMCQNAGYTSTDEAFAYATEVFETKYKNRGKNFANAREVRNFFEAAIIKQSDRLFGMENPTNEELCTLILEDVK